jgi:hypothetical protein
MKKRTTTYALAAAALLLAGPAASAQIRLVSSVIGAGGGVAAGAGGGVVGTVGQGIIGPVTATGRVAWQGFWYTSIPAIPLAVPGESETAETGLSVSPNPISTEATIRVAIPRSGRASLIMFDALGREVMTLADGIQDAGTLAVRVDGSMLPSGSYTIRLVAGEVRRSIRVIVAK